MRELFPFNFWRATKYFFLFWAL